MIRIKVKTKKMSFREASETRCPYLFADEELFVGTEFCMRCKYHINHHKNIVWCGCDEHTQMQSE